MINISAQQLIQLWVELEDAYNGVNGYGSTVAEVYAYTLEPNMPGYSQGKGTYDAEYENNAAVSLYNVLVLFKKHRECFIFIDDRKFGKWIMKERFQHRVHIEIRKKKEKKRN